MMIFQIMVIFHHSLQFRDLSQVFLQIYHKQSSILYTMDNWVQ